MAFGGDDTLRIWHAYIARKHAKEKLCKGEMVDNRRMFSNPILEPIFVATKKERLHRMGKPISPFIINNDSNSGQDIWEKEKMGKSKSTQKLVSQIALRNGGLTLSDPKILHP